MYLNMGRLANAKTQLGLLESAAKAAGNDSLATDLLYTRAAYFYITRQDKQGDEAVRQLRKSVGMVDSKLTPERFKLLTRLLIVVVYKNNGHLEEALAEALEVERLARGVAIDIQEQACRQIVALCRKTHRADSALVWGERQLALRDSIFSHQQYSRIRDLDTSYEIQKVDAKLQQSETDDIRQWLP